MTTLLIEGIEAVLPEDFSVAVKRCNPLLTNNGEFTYDIKLRMDNSVNADLFANINRPTTNEIVKTGRTAVLIADNRVYCRGTEHVTAWTDSEVTIQITGDSSEMNAELRRGMMIDDLEGMPVDEFDFVGWNTPRDFSKDYSYNHEEGVECNYNMAYDENSRQFMNKVRAQNGTLMEDRRSDEDGMNMPEWTFHCPQPYLIAYIREVVKAMGYSMSYNFLEETAYKNAYLVNTSGNDWKSVAHGWTVKEFIEEVEKLFNGIFVTDSTKKEVGFFSKANFYAGRKAVHVQDTVDEYEASVVDSMGEYDLKKSSIKYSVDGDYWKLRRVDRETIEMAGLNVKELEEGVTLKKTLDNALKSVVVSEEELAYNVYHDAKSGGSFVFAKNDMIEASGVEPERVFFPFNRFADIDRGEGADEIEMEITPTELRDYCIDVEIDGKHDEMCDIHMKIPSMKNGITIPDDLSTKVEDVIGGNSIERVEKNKLCLALYSFENAMDIAGKNVLWGYDAKEIGKIKLHKAYTDNIREATFGVAMNWQQLILDEQKIEEGQMVVRVKSGLIYRENEPSLTLKEMEKSFYSGGYEIELENEVKISSYDQSIYPPEGIFEIRNKRYVCKEIEYSIGVNGRSGPWKGTFYPIKIADTDADAKWILTDGKWRDGGVWIENGRWMDS